MKLQPVIEGLLSLSGDEGITLSQLAGCLEEEQPEKIEDIMDEISKRICAGPIWYRTDSIRKPL